MTNFVLIVNGRARAGKDTFVELARQALTKRHIQSLEYSSIAFAKDVSEFMGLDTSNKTEADRDFWSALGDAAETHSHYRSKLCARKAQDYFLELSAYGKEHAFFFLHVREEKIAKRVEDFLKDLMLQRVKFFRILIRGPREVNVQSNPSDANVMDMPYNFSVTNDGTLEEYAKQADDVIASLLDGSLKESFRLPRTQGEFAL